MAMKKSNSNAVSGNSKDEMRSVSPDEVYANKKVIMEVAKRLGWDYDSRKDLVQKLALKCWNDSRILFNPLKGTLTGYLARIARNMAVDMMRKAKHLPLTMENMELVARMDAEAPETDDKELYEWRMKLLERGIREMYRRYPSKDGNDAFVMFAWDGMSAKQVAEKLRVEERFVNVAVYRGLERLTNIVRQMERDENCRDAC